LTGLSSVAYSEIVVTIQIDEQTAEGLARQARSAGLSVAEYLRTLVPRSKSAVRADWDEIERQFLALSADGPSLPPDFSRSDIYSEHD
jgi:hypothetical protein